MAKKRKITSTTPKSSDNSTNTSQQPKRIQKKIENAQEQGKNQQLQPQIKQEKEELQLHDDVEVKVEVEEDEVEYEEFEEEFEEEEEVEEDGDESKRGEGGDGGEEEEEEIEKLLEPFTKEQLMMIVREASEIHPDVATRVRKVADEDTVHRKIFVHGLGWDTTEESLRDAFSNYGEIEDCKAVTDKVSGKSKGYGFILFRTRAGARKALKEPQKKIGNRMTACQLAAVGPVAGGGVGSVKVEVPVSEYTARKIYVSNVSADIDPRKLLVFFSKFGEIEEGPLGLDKVTGKPKGFCLFVYKSVESAKKALEEPHKKFEGHVLHCQKAIDGPKPGKQHMGMVGGSSRGGHYGGRGENPNLAGAIGGGVATGAGLMGQSVGGVGFNQGVAGSGAAPGLNPALGQALTALLASQGAGLGLNNLLGSLGGGVPGAGAHSAYGAQGVGVSPSVLGGYGAQGGLQSAYPNQQGGSGRSQHGHMGPYNGH